MWNPTTMWRHPGRIWRDLCLLATGMVTSPVLFSVMITLVAVTAGLAVTFVLMLPFAWLMFGLGHVMASIERNRLRSLADVDIADPVPPLTARRWFGRLKQRATSLPRWKEIGYLLLHFPLSYVGAGLGFGVWCGGLTLVGLPLWVGALPGETAKFGLFEVGAGAGAWLGSLAGLVVLFLAPWITRGVCWALAAAGRFFLGPNRDAVLTQEVVRLESSRTAAVDSAEAERRRIERDLHDGAQQRLVALAAGLGAAREKLEAGDEAGGRALVTDAHEEAKAALKEIRDLVRGINPVILQDRGLDAALSAVVARAPVPVSLQVHVDPRPSEIAESTAYFVVNEALTNVARHAHATRAAVAIVRSGERLVIEVRDDGSGGADASKGSGLQGLRDRVGAVGGTMHVISPPGGPTTLTVEIPCGS
jgi:signal transduction histidine kinase